MPNLDQNFSKFCDVEKRHPLSVLTYFFKLYSNNMSFQASKYD